MTTANQLAGYASSLPNFRNRIINGDMRIDQRNAGSAVTANNASNNVFCVDRWQGAGETSDGVFTLQRSTVAPVGFTNSLLATVTTPDSSIGSTQRYFIQQRVEGFNIDDFAWGTASAKSITLSFWVRSSLTGGNLTFGGSLLNSARDRAYPFSYVINEPNIWEHKTITIPGDNVTSTWLTDNGIGIFVTWGFGVGSALSDAAGAWTTSSPSTSKWSSTGATNLMGTSGATFYITGVQLEEGTVATPFEHRPIGVELGLCQRYFEKSYNLDVAPGTSTQDGSFRTVAPRTISSPVDYMYSVQYKVTKRAGTDLIIYSTDGTQGSVRDISGGTNTTLRTSLGAASNLITSFDIVDTRFYAFQWTANAEL